MELVNGDQRPKCRSCGLVVYFDPKIAAVVLVSQRDDLLFVRRAIEPMLGRWSFPSGYVDRGEVVEHAAVREVREETNLDVELTGLVGVYSSDGNPVVLIAYAARVTGGNLRAGEETQDARFFPIDALPDLPFPHDDQILGDWAHLSQVRPWAD
ncbi:MAG: NUDIX domain-containing protein [Chloroflexi bacterium]|nr:NUDIX domain-containing protein [Chloroflexota bacterium]